MIKYARVRSRAYEEFWRLGFDTRFALLNRRMVVHLLQVYSNPAMSRVSPQVLLYRSKQARRRDQTSNPPRRLARQLRDQEIDNLVARYLKARNVRQVAREFGLSRTTVAKHLAARGIDTSRGMTGADIRAAARLYEQGLGSGRIGQQLGFDNHTILNALRRSGIEIRPAGAPGATNEGVPSSPRVAMTP